MFGHPVFQNTRALVIAAADTNATRMTELPARLVILRCRTGSFKILGVDGTTPDADGLTLASTSPPIQLWVTNLNQLGYKAATGGDVLEVIRQW